MPCRRPPARADIGQRNGTITDLVQALSLIHLTRPILRPNHFMFGALTRQTAAVVAAAGGAGGDAAILEQKESEFLLCRRAS